MPVLGLIPFGSRGSLQFVLIQLESQISVWNAPGLLHRWRACPAFSMSAPTKANRDRPPSGAQAVGSERGTVASDTASTRPKARCTSRLLFRSDDTSTGRTHVHRNDSAILTASRPCPGSRALRRDRFAGRAGRRIGADASLGFTWGVVGTPFHRDGSRLRPAAERECVGGSARASGSSRGRE